MLFLHLNELFSTIPKFFPFFSHLFSRNHYRSPDGYSNLQVLLVLISLKVRPKRRSCPVGANPYVGNNLESRNSNTKNLEVRDSALLIISLTVNCCSDPVRQDVRQLCDDLSWQDGLGPRYTFGEIKTGIQEDAPPSLETVLKKWVCWIKSIEIQTAHPYSVLWLLFD